MRLTTVFDRAIVFQLSKEEDVTLVLSLGFTVVKRTDRAGSIELIGHGTIEFLGNFNGTGYTYPHYVYKIPVGQELSNHRILQWAQGNLRTGRDANHEVERGGYAYGSINNGIDS